ncbi:MAG: EF-P lysine aminoacylase GenX [Alphaproteobacteria bacterium]|nr:EF-P lysine aminoacylase GenX [Alphaproteobacteria bacterium]
MAAPTAPWWRPDAFARRLPYLQTRERIVQTTRAFFAGEKFHEAETPYLQISPGMEVHLHAFATTLLGAQGGQKQLYLHTSPEFAMKKLLVAGMPRIFQMARVWRNRERSATHHPEFTMLEWYRANAGYRDLMRDCVQLVRGCAAAAGRTRMQFRGMSCDVTAEWETLGVAEAFASMAGIDLLATAPDPASPDRTLLAREAERTGVRVAETDTWDDIFFRIMFEKIEPRLGNGRPTFLCDYPVSMAALARPKPENPRLAERFELYICGLELANAFGELTDPVEQRARFIADMALKEKFYGERHPIDEDFIAALEHGMPPSAGIALGFDRLAMLCAGTEIIDDVLWAPVVNCAGDDPACS